MLRALYSALTWCAQPLLRRKLARRGRVEPGYLEAIDERFGRYQGLPPASERQGLLWIHAVSLGETRAAAILLAALRERDPGLRVLLTHGTATGREEGRRLLRPGDLQAWLPWDTPGAVARFLDGFNPAAGVLMETEVWPNLVAACAARGVPLALANARLNERSLARGKRLAPLSRPAFGALAAVWAQTEADAARLRAAGARVDGVFGNLKFDATPDPDQRARGNAWRVRLGRPVLMLASSREGEERLWIEAWRACRRADPMLASSVQWLVVPRHPQRFDEVHALFVAEGLSVARRSALPGAEAPWPEADVWLGDSLGEMALYYGLADVALLGGSFEPLGGQNLIEAAACGCPVLMGPHTFNFAEAAELAKEAGAAFEVDHMAAAVALGLDMVRRGGRRDAAATAALGFAAAHRGAARRTADAVAALLRAPAAR